MLDKAQLIKIGSRRIEEVDIASLKAKVGIRAITGAESEAYSESITTKSKDKDGKEVSTYEMKAARAKLVALCVSDEQGQALLTVDEANALDNKVLNELFEASQEVNGVKGAAQKAETKNDSPATPVS